MQYFTVRDLPASLMRDGWWLDRPAPNLRICSKNSRAACVPLFKGYRHSADARNLAASHAAPIKGHRR